MTYGSFGTSEAVAAIVTLLVLIGLVAYIAGSFRASHFPALAIATLVLMLWPSIFIMLNASMGVVLAGWWITCLVVVAVGVYALLQGEGGLLTLALGGFAYLITIILTALYVEQPWLMALAAVPALVLPFLMDRA